MSHPAPGFDTGDQRSGPQPTQSAIGAHVQRMPGTGTQSLFRPGHQPAQSTGANQAPLQPRVLIGRGERGPPGPRGLPGLRGPPGESASELLTLIFNQPAQVAGPMTDELELARSSTSSVFTTIALLPHNGREPLRLSAVVGCSHDDAVCHLDIFDRKCCTCIARLEWRGQGPLLLETNDFFGLPTAHGIWQLRFGILWPGEGSNVAAHLYSICLELAPDVEF